LKRIAAEPLADLPLTAVGVAVTHRATRESRTRRTLAGFATTLGVGVDAFFGWVRGGDGASAVGSRLGGPGRAGRGSQQEDAQTEVSSHGADISSTPGNSPTCLLCLPSDTMCNLLVVSTAQHDFVGCCASLDTPRLAWIELSDTFSIEQ
jgi:hypothetical protein